MASGRWRASTALNELVVEQYGRFNVFQLIRLLLRRGPGRDWPIARRLRFQAELSARFQGAEVTRLAARRRGQTGPATAEEPSRIVVHTPNYCVASELGPLPAPFLEWVREQQRVGAYAMADFFNVFNQRIHVLRYELKQRSLRALDPALPPDTRYAEQLAAAMGLALPAQQAQIPLSKRAWLGMASLLINNRRSPAVVAQVVARYLGVPVRLRSLVGRWRDIEADDRMRLGRWDRRLGRESVLGRRMWDSQAGVRLEVGVMEPARIVALLPLRASRANETLPPTAHAAFVSLIHLLLDRRYDCEVSLSVERSRLPPAHLTRAGNGVGLRLGQTAWLIGAATPPAADAPAAADLPAIGRLRFLIPAYAETSAHEELAA